MNELLLWMFVFVPVVAYIAWPYVRPRSRTRTASIDASPDEPRPSATYQQARAAFTAAMEQSGGRLAGGDAPLALASAAPCTACGQTCDAGDRFCPGCGARLVPHTPHESLATLLVEPVAEKPKRLLGWALLLCTSAVVAQAQSGMPSPHSDAPSGQITGVLKIPPAQIVRNTPYRVEVRKDGATLVSVVKQTDADGRFTIRNVLPTPSLHYVLTATVGDRTYVSSLLQLPPDTPILTTDVLLVADAAARSVDPKEKPVMPQMPAEVGSADAAAAPSSVPRTNRLEGNPGFRPNPVRLTGGAWGREQWIAIVLSGAAVVLVAFQVLTKR